MNIKCLFKGHEWIEIDSITLKDKWIKIMYEECNRCKHKTRLIMFGISNNRFSVMRYRGW